ncbi:hypothetical protein AA105894_1658 [Asaia spathodeae NBRC 105894]|uniref:Uncharacterized protein n=1 Tax=Asaia spathodeae TaxID=657016 RepID=A0ABX2P8C1_9PROT|nr:hypothetical protein AA105894_1658 [Asaia spathodeae NBRC 105894]
MKREYLIGAKLALVSLTIGALVVPTSARAADPCTVLMCMSGLVGNGTPPPTCQPAIDVYFSLIVFHITYDPISTAALRLKYLETCPGWAANAEWVAAIQAAWGTVP